jgi:predicted aldo/keto reductase-like oxidoreductase
MSSSEQMADNVRTFSEDKPLSAGEKEMLMEIAETLKQGVPCTACR